MLEEMLITRISAPCENYHRSSSEATHIRVIQLIRS